ncbi:possible Transcription initiation factor IIA, gam [Prochlorococcus marinus str. MIT 9313]|uniref:Possible Transcription initiation factor IIA, gam n=1 Tax=Prochlorococcus marinus (strain MIT 9313) TaxID=74547 RepID=Q7TUV6_PROMM|nr:possible Transcription initiation factor IIA, gam [Prochlorococcus marinus str. MIT 9313]
MRLTKCAEQGPHQPEEGAGRSPYSTKTSHELGFQGLIGKPCQSGSKESQRLNHFLGQSLQESLQEKPCKSLNTISLKLLRKSKNKALPIQVK